MATIQKMIVTKATPEQAWDALRDVGALHTKLVPGFVIDTKLEPGTRIVTFGNGAVLRERIVSIDETLRRRMDRHRPRLRSSQRRGSSVAARERRSPNRLDSRPPSRRSRRSH
jgi:hypothetical protein